MSKKDELMWSQSVDRSANELSISGISATKLANDFGTPAFILDDENKTGVIKSNN